jgi:hypothetical protein
MYEPHCGLDNVKFAYGHDEYMYQMLVRLICKYVFLWDLTILRRYRLLTSAPFPRKAWLWFATILPTPGIPAVHTEI